METCKNINNIEFRNNNKHQPLSNSYESNFRIGNFIYPTVYHWYQSEKCEDFYEKLEIIMADTPKEAKEMGNEFKMKKNFKDIKLTTMFKGLKAKFEQNRDLKKLLLDTGDKMLVENSPVDDFWGRGKDWKGENKLGKLLMKLREDFQPPIPPEDRKLKESEQP